MLRAITLRRPVGAIAFRVIVRSLLVEVVRTEIGRPVVPGVRQGASMLPAAPVIDLRTHIGRLLVPMLKKPIS